MSKLLTGEEARTKKELLVSFCEKGMNEYTSTIFKAFQENDWTLLEEMSMKYEADCYSIGVIEIVGKLIKLRLLLQIKPVNKGIVESTLNIILDFSLKSQRFLIERLEKNDYPIVKSRLNLVSKPYQNSEELHKDWFYSNCLIY